MNELLAAARAVHFAATIWVFGELAFACALARGRRSVAAAGPGEALRRRLPSIVRLSLGVGIASAVVWLVAVAATMSGMPLSRAMAPSTLGAVLGGTLFGKVWILRLCLAGALLAPWPRSAGGSGWPLALRTVVAAAYLGSLAWTGHAAAAEAASRLLQLGSDVVHLLAAGAWLGALPALVHLLGRAQPIEDAAWAARRFSSVAIASVSALILSGIGSSWFLVGSIPALFGTRYGVLLLAKVALLAVMLALAAANRLLLTPRLAGGDLRAMRALRRNALLEIAAGLTVVIIVGRLGITIPAAHQSPLWPFAYSLGWAPVQESAARSSLLAASLVVAVVGLGVVIAGVHRRVWAHAGAGLAGATAAVVASAWLLAIPAYPTSYAVSPVRYTTTAIVGGAELFARHCVACHGSDGTGAALESAGRVIRPTNLVWHAAGHRPGE
ncbi:MAG: copper homeostasis membrane protein CopD, partial [Betaproteobacteria bacterium]